jgi:NADPH:quinone reductase-like Zn-dependent oxidoreductase
MRQIWITNAVPPEVLQVREVPDPTLQGGVVRICAEASGINVADLIARMGLYLDALKRASGPGCPGSSAFTARAPAGCAAHRETHHVPVCTHDQ